MFIDIFTDTLLDSLKLLPFLFITYIFIELIEHEVSAAGRSKMLTSHAAAPVLGAVLGIIPQCGLSAAAASLYAGRMISLGTLFAIFLSCSDEMLPIMIAENVALDKMIKILAIKASIGAISGLALNYILVNRDKYRQKHSAGTAYPKNRNLHSSPSASSTEHSAAAKEGFLGHSHPHLGLHMFLSVLKHTIEVFLYIFIITFALNAVMQVGGEGLIRTLFTHVPVIGEAVAALIGLIPNCASSVALTELYLTGSITEGAMMAGLLTNSGTGLLVLLRQNHDKKENLRIILLLIALGMFWGILIDAVGITL